MTESIEHGKPETDICAGKAWMQTAPPASEKELVAWAKNGSKAALEELLRRSMDRLYAIARRYSDTKEDAEDVVQETLLRAFRSLQDFREEAQFSSWITRIAINAALSARRKTSGVKTIPLFVEVEEDSVVAPIPLADPGLDPEQELLRHELRTSCLVALDRLEPEQSRVLRLFYLHEGNVNEMADILGVNTSTAKSRLIRARAKLKRALKWRGGASSIGMKKVVTA